jgi:hypothetical protein
MLDRTRHTVLSSNMRSLYLMDQVAHGVLETFISEAPFLFHDTILAKPLTRGKAGRLTIIRTRGELSS